MMNDEITLTELGVVAFACILFGVVGYWIYTWSQTEVVKVCSPWVRVEHRVDTGNYHVKVRECGEQCFWRTAKTFKTYEKATEFCER